MTAMPRREASNERSSSLPTWSVETPPLRLRAAPLDAWDGTGIFRQVNHMFRILRDGSDHILDVDQVEAIEPAVRSSKRGRYHVDQIERDLLPSGTLRDAGVSRSIIRTVG